MACLPIAIHTSISCLLGLAYGCGYISSIASYEIFNKKKKSNTKPSIEIPEIKSDIPSNNNNNKITVQELLETLEALKQEFIETKERIELFDTKLDYIQEYKPRSTSF